MRRFLYAVFQEVAMTNPFTRLFRARDKPSKRTSPKDAVSAAPTFYFGSSISGKSVTARSAIQLSTVYPAVLSGDGIDFHVALVVAPHQTVQVRRAKAAAFSAISCAIGRSAGGEEFCLTLPKFIYFITISCLRAASAWMKSTACACVASLPPGMESRS